MASPQDHRKCNIIESLKEFASAEFQEQGWVKGQVHDYCTYTESMCRLFDDGCFDAFIDEDEEEFDLSAEQITALDKFRSTIRAFDSKYEYWDDPKVIINDPEWPKVRVAAQNALKCLGIEHYLDPSKEIFRHSLLNTIYTISQPLLQEQIWIKERRPNSNPFQELILRFFSSYKAKDLIEHYKDYEISENQVQKLKELYGVLKTYHEKHSNAQDLKQIINDPQWHKIQALAGEVSKAFDFNPYEAK